MYLCVSNMCIYASIMYLCMSIMCIYVSILQVCSMADHQVCFEKTRENNPWFPHTVEEMVIWTVERETGKWMNGEIDQQMDGWLNGRMNE